MYAKLFFNSTFFQYNINLAGISIAEYQSLSASLAKPPYSFYCLYAFQKQSAWSVQDKGKLSNGAGEGNVLVNSVASCWVIIQEGCRSALDTVIYFSCNVLPLGFDTEYIKNLVMHAKLYFSESYILHLTHAVVCFFIYKIYL